jgi:hypothetical protein
MTESILHKRLKVLDPLRTALHEQLLASNTNKQDLSKTSFGASEIHNGVAKLTFDVQRQSVTKEVLRSQSLRYLIDH